MKPLNLIRLFLIAMFYLMSTFAYSQASSSEDWLQEEFQDKQEILSAFWENRIIKYKPESVNQFKLFLFQNHFPKNMIWESNINTLFANAISHKINFTIFYNALKDEPLVFFYRLNQIEKLVPENTYEEIEPNITQADLSNIQQYIHKKHLSVSITLGSAKSGLITPDFPENLSQYPFAIHSVGKVFTGVLVLMMIENGVLTERDLQSLVQLDQTVYMRLPRSVLDQLRKVTLYQLMTHKSGLGDYLGHYCDAIASGHLPVIRRVEDFLPFIDEEVFPVGVEHYSNAGLLLTGLAIKHAYETKYKHPINYDLLLNNMLIKFIGLNSFSILKPDNAKYNLQDPIAPFIAGSPAGGYWVTSSDLGKFAQWLYQKSLWDSKFNYLMKKYGQEFYHSENDTIAHAGGIPSSTAFLSISLKTGAVLIIESNQPTGYGDDLKTMIQHHIFAKKSERNNL